MKKRLAYLLTAVIGMVVILCSISVFADTEEKTSTTKGTLYANIMELKQPEGDSKHVYFGNYPQREIVSEASQCGTYGKTWSFESDYIVDANLYTALQDAEWDSNEDTIVEGSKYHRIKKSDATKSTSGNNAFYNWSDSTTYHYFKYEPIIWRILKLTDDDAFLLSEGALDDQKYNRTYTSITWENSTVRNWLNNSFYNMAFSKNDKSVIKTTTVLNANNIKYNTAGGNNTEDKVFLLSENEVYGSNVSEYGFASSADAYDTARQMKSSTYAKAMGTYANTDSSYLGNCWWWLRSPGYSTYNAAYVSNSGYVNRSGNSVSDYYEGILPALHINLKSKNPVTACETVEDITLSTETAIYTGSEIEPDVTIAGLTENEDYTVSYANNTEVGTATVTVTGIGDCSGTITKTFAIKKDITQEGFALSKTTYTYTGEEITPKVVSVNLSKDTDYSVSYESNTNAGTAKAIITGIGDYTGTKEIEFTIEQQSIADKVVTVDADSLVYDGKAKSPTVTIEGLTKDKDYTVEYAENVNAGEATATITGIGNYTGTIEKKFTIAQQDISEMEITLDPEYCVYDGTAKTPTATIAGLTAETDYDVEYSDNTEIGTANVTATGKGNYTGTTSKNFKIGKDISELEINLSQDEYVYSGKENKPTVTIVGLTEGVDFTVGYVDNVNAGTATAHVISTGDYVGYNSKTFTIKPYRYIKESVTEGTLERLTTLEQPDSTHVYFGSYPQTEIVSEASQCGTYGKDWESSSDYIVDETLYAELQYAEWDSNGDTEIAGNKYHRILKSDATYSPSGNWDYYSWSDSTTYHYFKYESIKWRILKISDDDAFLLSEGALDDQQYNTSRTSITWENSTLRSWLNSSFYNMAFTDDEKAVIKTTTVVNSNNKYYATVGGNNTEDKVFLLSEDEVYGSVATDYGFVSSYVEYDTARQMKSSTYAKAMGTYASTYTTYLGSCWWWLRSPGENSYYAAFVINNGYVDRFGNVVDADYGIIPALHINLKSKNPVTACETVADITLSPEKAIYTGSEIRPEVTIVGLTENDDYTVSYANNTEVGTATVTVTGSGDYSGNITKTFEIIEKNPIELDEEEYTYDGAAHEPAVSIDGLEEGTDYDVEYRDNTNAGTATAVVTLKGNYAGELTKNYTIKSCDISEMKATLSDALFIYSGQANEPTVTIEGLTQDRDFEVTYSDNIEAGQATATITGIGNYQGTTVKNFRIGYVIEDDPVLSETEVLYDGTPKEPNVTWGNLVRDVDFTVEYSDNTKVGTAKVKVTGIGKYVGNDSLTFEIVSPDISSGYDINFNPGHIVYTGSAITPDVSIEGLTEDTDYTVEYRDNTEVGEASVVLSGIGSYRGTVTKTFEIHKLTENAAHDPKCTETGNTAYWSCSCGKYFSDSEGKTEIEEASWIVAAKGHTLTKTEAKDATCTEAGNSAYWTCSDCSKYFSDADGNNEIAENSWIIKAIGHTMTGTAQIKATVKKSGNIEYWYCSECEKYFSDANGDTQIAENSRNVAQIDAETISLAETKYIYDGTAREPEVTISDVDGRALTAGTDFTVAYSDNTNVGMATATITFTGNYGGTIKKNFEIKKAEPTFEVPTGLVATYGDTLDDVKLPNGFVWTDSTLDVGEVGSHTFTAIYVPADSDNYRIVRNIDIAITVKKVEIIDGEGLNIELSDTDYVYDGKEKKPYPIITGLDGRTLTKGVDYVVEYSNNTDAGTATAAITFKGNYSGSVEKTYTIKALSVGVELLQTSFKYKGKAIEPEFEIQASAGLTPVEGTDYTVSYSDNNAPGTGHVLVSFSGNYSGSIDKEFEIIRTYNLEGSVLGCSSKNEADITIKDESGNETELTTTDGKYSFNWIDGGDYTITVKGTGDFISREYTKTVDNDYKEETFEIRELGDVNCDGVRSAEDITRLARHVAKISVEDDPYKLLLFNTDRSTVGDTAAAKIDAADITHLARFVAKIIDAL